MPQEPDLTNEVTAAAAALHPAFDCSWAETGRDAAWVRVSGDLDLATVPQLERVLRESQLQARLVVVDLREIAFMDSSGMHALVDAGMRARQVGRRLVLLRGSPNVDRVFGLTGRSADVEVYDLDPAEPPVQALLHIAKGESDGSASRPPKSRGLGSSI